MVLCTVYVNVMYVVGLAQLSALFLMRALLVAEVSDRFCMESNRVATRVSIPVEFIRHIHSVCSIANSKSLSMQTFSGKLEFKIEQENGSL